MRCTVTDDLAACLALRRAVFIDEQGVPEALELDGRDAEAIHLIGHRDGQAIASARMFIVGDTAKIGRVCVVAPERGTGAGAAIMRACLDEARRRGALRARLSSQTHATGFYERLGFAAHGPEYLDAGIPHRDMLAELAPADGTCVDERGG